jgi:GNAT superfamily N-acetyltransferase
MTIDPVRRALPTDAHRLAEIATAAYAIYLPRMPDGRRPAPMSADYAAHVRDDEVWVIEQDGDPVAYLVLVPREDHLLLDNVAVDPRVQGAGLGATLLDLADERARVLGLPEIRLYTHVVMVENQARYRRRGYVETDRTERNGFARVHYTKRL